MDAVLEVSSLTGVRAACDALSVARASLYRQQRPILGPVGFSTPLVAGKPPTSPARSLSAAERDQVLSRLHEDRFQDRSPSAVYATLLDEGVYHCSIRTMYRLLQSRGESRERRDQLTHPAHQKPELLATGPNQLWSWDITKLLGPAKWTYFYLYVILDVFGRYVVSWMVAPNESAELAKRLIADTCQKQPGVSRCLPQASGNPEACAGPQVRQPPPESKPLLPAGLRRPARTTRDPGFQHNTWILQGPLIVDATSSPPPPLSGPHAQYARQNPKKAGTNAHAAASPTAS